MNVENNEYIYQDRLLRVQKVLEILDISESTFWEGVRIGRFPKPVKLGPRITRWRESEILALMNEQAE